MAEAARAGCDSQGGDMAVPGKVVGVLDARCRGLVGADWGCVRRRFEFSEDCSRSVLIHACLCVSIVTSGNILYPSIWPFMPSMTWHSSGHRVRYSR